MLAVGRARPQFDGRLLGYDIPLVVAWVRDPGVRHIFMERLAGRYEPVAEVHDYLTFLRRPPAPLAADDPEPGAVPPTADGSGAVDDAAAPAIDTLLAAGSAAETPASSAAPALSQVLASPPRGAPAAPGPSDLARPRPLPVPLQPRAGPGRRPERDERGAMRGLLTDGGSVSRPTRPRVPPGRPLRGLVASAGRGARAASHDRPERQHHPGQRGRAARRPDALQALGAAE